jgi:FkbH-like protein
MAARAAEVGRAWRAHRRSGAGETDICVGIAASFTCDPVEAALGVGLLERGFEQPEFRLADYNQLHQLCLDPEGILGGPVDHVVAMWRIEDIWSAAVERYLAGQDEALGEIVAGVTELAGFFARLETKPYSVTVSTPPLPVPWGVDMRDSRVSLRLVELHRSCLEAWLGEVRPTRLSTVDLATLCALFGMEAAADHSKWALYRQPYSSAFWVEVGTTVAELVAREKTAAPKCLVLDCDNTLWGGVIGEDGLGGIALGENFPGAAFQTFQRRILQLKEAGVFLAIASKNDHSAVMDVFEKHDGMVLTADDIAIWKVNWAPKSGNIAEIAAELNIGVDSLVFVDDSSYEIAEVMASQPAVTCVQVPEEPSEIPSVLAETGLFRHLRVSDEDRLRTSMVLAEREREHQTQALSPEEFLESLQLEVHFFEPEPEHVGRVAQLTNKTNQFNLTTIRRTEADVAALLASPVHEVRSIRVSDRFGDYGIVGVSVTEQRRDEWFVDSFLMSCRVLGRGVESAFLRAIIDDAQSAGAATVRGSYVPTPKNGQVADFFDRHGFSATAEGPVVSVVDADESPAHITTVR